MERKKHYQKPVMKKVDLRVTESVLTACKTSSSAIVQPNGTKNRACTHTQAQCVLDLGS